MMFIAISVRQSSEANLAGTEPRRGIFSKADLIEIPSAYIIIILKKNCRIDYLMEKMGILPDTRYL